MVKPGIPKRVIHRAAVHRFPTVYGVGVMAQNSMCSSLDPLSSQSALPRGGVESELAFFAPVWRDEDSVEVFCDILDDTGDLLFRKQLSSPRPASLQAPNYRTTTTR